MPRRYPPLTPADVRDILKAAGFVLDRTQGSHEHWEHESLGGKRRLVTVDGAYPEFGTDRIRTMIAQSGISRDDFYRQTAGTARKINKRVKRG